MSGNYQKMTGNFEQTQTLKIADNKWKLRVFSLFLIVQFVC